jgi:PAB-dependent poly(A)-specific ribonuclease subunit 3
MHVDGFLHSTVDRLEAELMSELESGRLVRLLTKMGFINERPGWVISLTPA